MPARRQKVIRPWPLSLLPYPLISDSMRVFLAARVVDTVAWAMMAIAAFLAFSIASYSAGDPAWNIAGSAESIQNWMGVAGAYSADLFIQTVGYGVWGLIVIMGVSGYRLWKRKEARVPMPLRLMTAIFSVFSLAVAFAVMAAPEAWGGNMYRGGVIGATGLNKITGVLPFVPWAISAFGFVCGAIFAAIAVGYPWQSWKKGWRRTVAAISWAVYRFRSAIGWVNHYDAMAQSSRSSVPALPKSKPQKIKPVLSDDDVIEQVSVQPREVVEPIVVKPQKSNADSQKSLSLKARNDDDWDYPSLDLLQDPPEQDAEKLDEQSLQRNAMLLQQVLQDFSVQGEIVKIHPGPVVTLYELEPAPGVKSSRIIGLADDIARSMSAVSVRAAVVPGRNVIGIEIPNKKRAIVFMRDILAGKEYQDTKCKLPLVLGKDIGGQPIIADLARMPHLLVAGTTGSGKSVAVNTMLLSLLYKLPPEKCRFIMIDPKMLELSVYNDIPHLLSPVVTEPGKAVVALKWAVHEMEERYRAMSKVGVRNIDGYNERIRQAQKKGEVLSRRVQTGFDPDTGKPTYEEQPIELVELPYIVIIVDEFADLMLVAGKDVENAIQRLAQMARAAGLHIIMATQRPSVDVITGVIKANFPTRISFQVTSKIDSRTILGEGGAEQLLGMGDMLYMAGGGQIKRVHGPFVADEEVQDVVDHLKNQAEPDYLDTMDDSGGNGVFDMFGGGDEEQVDELYDEAVAIIAREGKASTSFIQRHLQIGYNRAARIIEEMERQGVVSPATATGKREVLIGER